MTEAKRKKLMYGVLIAAVLFGLWNFTHPPKRRQHHADESRQPAPAADSTIEAEKPIDVAAKQNEPWGRDPFGSTGARTVRATVAATANGTQLSWSLTGIIYSASSPLAFINGQMVKIGDRINSAKVVAIDKEKVTLQYNGNQFELFVHKG